MYLQNKKKEKRKKYTDYYYGVLLSFLDLEIYTFVFHTKKST